MIPCLGIVSLFRYFFWEIFGILSKSHFTNVATWKHPKREVIVASRFFDSFFKLYFFKSRRLSTESETENRGSVSIGLRVGFDSNHRSRSARLSAVFLQTRGHRRTARMRGTKRALYRERSGESLHITQYGSRGNLDFLQYRSVVLKQRRSSLLEKMQMKGLTPAWAKLIHTAAVRYPPGTTGPRANTLQ